MKNLAHFLLIFTFLTSHLIVAQDHSVAGKVIEQASKEPIEYASVGLYSAKDSSLIDGTITDAAGQFTIKTKASSRVFLSVSFLGYEVYNSNTFLVDRDLVLDNIGLVLNNNTLSTVEVSGKAITSVHKLDKQVFDASQFQNARGGSATDVLSNLPSVSLNSFGELTVRGASGFMVMINGKAIQGDPSLILNQLSANTIEDIEIVTAPSAKFDPDGNAGIINIKTKQAILDGNYLIVNTLAGLPSIEPYDNKARANRYGVDITYNVKKNKINFSSGLDYRRYDISGRREGYVNTYIGDILTEFPSDGERSFDETNYSARASLEYTPSDNQAFTAGIYAGKRTKDRTADILYLNQQRAVVSNADFLDTEAYYDLYLQNNAPLSEAEVLNKITYFNENLRVRKSDFFIGSMDYTYIFSDNSILKLSGLYERTILGGPTDNANLAYPNTDEILQLQFNDNNNPLDGIRLKADFVKEIKDQIWESGYQFRFLNHPGDFDYFDRDLINNIWVENPLFTNKIELQRTIHSAYSQVSGKRDKLQYSVGFRLEYFDRNVKIERPDEIFNLDRFNLFPSVNIGYAINENLSLKGAYSKRIERTTTFKMTPFPEREHSETLEQGDSELLPEFIDLVELGLVNNWGDNSVFLTGYYRRTQNVINRVNTVFNDTILNRIYTNVGMANALGMEFGTTIYPTSKWKFYLSANLFNYRIQGDLFGESINTANNVYSINANTNYNFTSSLSLQLALNYLSKRITAQGQDSEFYNPSLTLRKQLMDKKLTLSLQWKNIDMGLWNANEQRITTVQNNFYTTTNYVYEVDILQLSVSYQINQPATKINLPESEFGKKEF